MPGLDPNTKLLVHFFGADGATAYTSEDAGARTLTFEGAAQIDTAQYKFAPSSLLLDGDGDYVTVPDSADFDFAGDYTIDLQVYYTTAMADKGWISSLDESWLFMMGEVGGQPDKLIFFDGTWFNAGGTSTSVTANAWHHVAVVRASGNLYFFLNGNLEKTIVGGTTNLNSNGLKIGWGYGYWNGWIAEVRLSNIARWTANFEAPANPYISYLANTQALFID